MKANMHSYWTSISKKERDRVEYLISDMYNPYINYSFHYFHNACSIVDSLCKALHKPSYFIKWINSSILTYINRVKKRYEAEDEKRLIEKNMATNRDHQTIKKSRELYILTHEKWVLLKDWMNSSAFTVNQKYISLETFPRH